MKKRTKQYKQCLRQSGLNTPFEMVNLTPGFTQVTQNEVKEQEVDNVFFFEFWCCEFIAMIIVHALTCLLFIMNALCAQKFENQSL